jgi:hypothetical protein
MKISYTTELALTLKQLDEAVRYYSSRSNDRRIDNTVRRVLCRHLEAEQVWTLGELEKAIDPYVEAFKREQAALEKTRIENMLQDRENEALTQRELKRVAIKNDLMKELVNAGWMKPEWRKVKAAGKRKGVVFKLVPPKRKKR